MKLVSETLSKLDPSHSAALHWFIEHAGTVQPWTPTLENGTRLVTKAKGIFKPADSKYALSIRQVLNSRYPDRDPILRQDGTWIYQYYQEGDIPTQRDDYFTNRSLLNCWKDEIPVGVLRQTSRIPVVRYQVLGLAIVAGWEGGYFFLEGFSPHGSSYGKGSHAEVEVLQSELDTVEPETSAFHHDDLLDSRQRVIASIVSRQGQKDFRNRLLKAYNYKCAVSRWEVIDILEAAHIVPYFGVQSNHISNGLLLRSDLHTLFDLGKLAIDPAEMTVIISKALYNTPYMQYSGIKIHLPTSVEERPSTSALNHHREWAGL